MVVTIENLGASKHYECTLYQFRHHLDLKNGILEVPYHVISVTCWSHMDQRLNNWILVRSRLLVMLVACLRVLNIN